MTSSWKLLPDEEPQTTDEAQRALIKACLQVIEEMHAERNAVVKSWLNKLDTLKVTKEDK